MVGKNAGEQENNASMAVDVTGLLAAKRGKFYNGNGGAGWLSVSNRHGGKKVILSHSELLDSRGGSQPHARSYAPAPCAARHVALVVKPSPSACHVPDPEMPRVQTRKAGTTALEKWPLAAP